MLRKRTIAIVIFVCTLLLHAPSTTNAQPAAAKPNSAGPTSTVGYVYCDKRHPRCQSFPPDDFNPKPGVYTFTTPKEAAWITVVGCGGGGGGAADSIQHGFPGGGGGAGAPVVTIQLPAYAGKTITVFIGDGGAGGDGGKNPPGQQFSGDYGRSGVESWIDTSRTFIIFPGGEGGKGGGGGKNKTEAADETIGGAGGADYAHSANDDKALTSAFLPAHGGAGGKTQAKGLPGQRSPYAYQGGQSGDSQKGGGGGGGGSAMNVGGGGGRGPGGGGPTEDDIKLMHGTNAYQCSGGGGAAGGFRSVGGNGGKGGIGQVIIYW